MRIAKMAWLVIALLLVGVGIGLAFDDKDETIVTVQVTSADHEADEGYFSLGEQATVMVKPGSELFRFLNRHRGQKVKIVLTQTAVPELSKIDR